LNAPSGYHSAVLAPTFQGGSGEHTIRLKFVSGNTILIGFARDYVDKDLSDCSDTCFYRSNGSNVYENGHGITAYKAIRYETGSTINTRFNMNTGDIVWTIEGTSSITPFKYPKLCSGTWIFSCVIYGAKVELLGSVGFLHNSIK